MMLTMAGTIFSLTLRSTGQAKALTDVTQRLRVFEQTLTEDLRNVRRGACKMVVESHGVFAYWTEAQKELDATGDPTLAPFPAGGDPERSHLAKVSGKVRLVPDLPRADVLMFFSARPGRSYLDPGVQAGTQMLVYGHAEVGEMQELVVAPGWAWSSPVQPFENRAGAPKYTTYAESTDNALAQMVFPRSARAWHIARRSVLVTNRDPGGTGAVTSLTDPKDPKKPNALLLTGAADILLSVSGGGFDFTTQVARGFSAVPETWYTRSQLDLTPPARLANRIGAYFLPNCASFKVEWALPLSRLPDPNGVLAGMPTVWIDPYRDRNQLADPKDKPEWIALLDRCLADMRNRYGLNSAEATAFEDFQKDVARPLPNGRFKGTTRHEWSAEDPGFSASKTPGDPDPYFPTALRITVDVYDDAARLDRPIRHTMVIPVGEG
jgi:hypothetical protein